VAGVEAACLARWLWLKLHWRSCVSSAGLLINSFWRLRQVDAGINTSMVTVGFTPPSARYGGGGLEGIAAELLSRAHPRLKALPGVEAAGAMIACRSVVVPRLGIRRMERSEPVSPPPFKSPWAITSGRWHPTQQGRLFTERIAMVGREW